MDQINECVYNNRLKIVFLWVVLLVGNIDLIENEQFYIVFFSDFTVASLGVLLLNSHYRLLRYLSMMFIILALILSIVNLMSFQLFDLGISIKFWKIILESNHLEFYEYFKQLLPHIQWGNIIFFGLITLVIVKIIMCIRKTRLFYMIFYTFFLIGFFIAGYLVIQPLGKKRINIVCRSVIDLYSAIRIVYSSNNSKLAEKIFTYEVKSELLTFDKIIFIIGESMSKYHMSLYDYNKNTTPRLNSIRDSLYIFKDVVSPFTGTSEVMEYLLTFKSVGDSLNWYDYPSMTDVLSRTDYDTYWYSNQEKAGVFGDCSGIISSKADSVKYVGMEYSGDHLYEVYDEKLFDEFRASLRANKKQFFVLHMFGSHPLYKRRYPKDIVRFSKFDYDSNKFGENVCQTKSEYDNSIYYSDSLLYESIKLLQDDFSEEKVLWIYLSDHGQDVFDFSNKIGHVAQSVEIPLIIWLNSKAKKDFGFLSEQISKVTEKKIMSDDFIHFLLMSMNISYPILDSMKNFANNSFKEKVRITDGEIYQYKSTDKLRDILNKY